MKLFSEKVTPTFTNSNYNVLTLKDYTEVFFDVYELEINGNKYVTEKVFVHNGNPVVSIPVVYEGKKLEILFTLQRGEFNVEVNSLYLELNQNSLVGSSYEDDTRSEQEEIEAIIFDKKESILKEIQQARKSATEFAENVKRQKIQESLTYINAKEEAITTTVDKLRGEMIDDFLHIVEDARAEVYTYNEQERKQTSKIISKALRDLSSELENNITLAEGKIKDYYDERITLIEGSITDIASENKEYFVELIRESKQSILNEVSQIKGTVPYVVNERAREIKGDVDVKSIKTDLEKTISNRFTQELSNVRRIIEMSSGGGSVAVQFANGGTMRGNLNVIGDISATGVIYNNSFSSINWNDTYTSVSNTSANWDNVYTSVKANSANWNDTYTSVSNTSANWDNVYTSVKANSANWDSAYTIASTYQTASSTFATIDYTNNTFFALTGGTIYGDTKIRFGDLTVFGNISATGSVNYANTFVSTTTSLCALANSTYPTPGLYVSQAGTGDIATFYDVSSEREVLHVGGSEGYPGVGINTSFPNKDFTVIGDISATGVIYNNGFDSTNWNDTYTSVKASSANWDNAYTNLVSNSAAYLSAVDTTITLTGDVLGSGIGAFNTTLTSVGSAGTYNNTSTAITPFTTDTKGRIISTGSQVIITPSWNNVTDTPTTLSGYGITDAVNAVATIVPISAATTFNEASNAKIFHVSNTTTLTLPVASTVSDGWSIGIVNVGGAPLTTNRSNSDTINGTLSTFYNTIPYSAVYIYKSSATAFIAIGVLY